MGAAAAEEEWFYLSLGHRRGPVSREDMCDMITKQEVYIDSTQVWKLGMKQWVNLADAKPFAASIKSIRSVAAQADARVVEAATSSEIEEDLISEGATRGLFNAFFYVGWLIPLFIGVVILSELRVQQLVTVSEIRSNIWLQMAPFFLSLVALWKMAAMRLRNAGYSTKHALGIVVPVYNVYVLFICMFAPGSYMRKKKLGKATVWYVLLFIGVATGLVLGVDPGVNLKTVSPMVVTEKMADFYDQRAHVSSRTEKNAAEAAEEKAEKEEK